MLSSRFRLLMAIAAVWLPIPYSIAAPGDTTLEIMAFPAGFATGPSLGHAFLCIGYQLNNGIKEDCYGFYPKAPSAMFVGGPGLVNSEFQKNPDRLGNISVSFKVVVTDTQRRAIVGLINQFNAKSYDLTSANCIDFSLSAIKVVGLKVPDRSKFQTPEQFVRQLKALNP